MDEIKLILPTIKAPTGESFEITPTEEKGVFKTYSGNNLNFGYGNTTYIAYVYSNDGRSMYYSDSRTNFTLTIPEPGEYKVHICAEKDYVAHNGKYILGFSGIKPAKTELVSQWKDDGTGTISASWRPTTETKVIFPESMRNLSENEKNLLETPTVYQFGSKDSTEEDYKKGLVSYYTKAGTRVREIHVPLKGCGKKTVIAGLCDMHINYVNEDDENDAEIQYTNKTRYWGYGNSLTQRALYGMAFADIYDQSVLAGDILDYMSKGAAKMVIDGIIKPYPNALMTIGGHDITKNMETGFRDVVPLEERRAFLKSFWPHDLFYVSKVVNDCVLCIAIDNGTGSYLDCQIEKFKADIELARKNGYTVLIFQHEPIASNIDCYAETTCLDDCIDPVKAIFNFCGSLNIGGTDRADSEATKQILDIIKNSSDVIGGVFSGHRHYNFYYEICANDGTHIPQYVMRASAYDEYGNVAKIVVE